MKYFHSRAPLASAHRPWVLWGSSLPMRLARHRTSVAIAALRASSATRSAWRAPQCNAWAEKSWKWPWRNRLELELWDVWSNKMHSVIWCTWTARYFSRLAFLSENQSWKLVGFFPRARSERATVPFWCLKGWDWQNRWWWKHLLKGSM